LFVYARSMLIYLCCALPTLQVLHLSAVAITGTPISGCIYIDTITSSVCVPVRVIHASETHTSAIHIFTVTRKKTNTCNSVAIKNFVKILKYLECFVNVYSAVTGNVVHSHRYQNCVISLLYAVKISNTICLLIQVA